MINKLLENGGRADEISVYIITILNLEYNWVGLFRIRVWFRKYSLSNFKHDPNPDSVQVPWGKDEKYPSKEVKSSEYIAVERY